MATLPASDGPYRMVQLPTDIALKTGHEAADYLQRLCNEQVKQGWHFYRVDSIPAMVPAGCLGGLFGAKATQLIMPVATFIRQAPGT